MRVLIFTIFFQKLCLIWRRSRQNSEVCPVTPTSRVPPRPWTDFRRFTGWTSHSSPGVTSWVSRRVPSWTSRIRFTLEGWFVHSFKRMNYSEICLMWSQLMFSFGQSYQFFWVLFRTLSLFYSQPIKSLFA